MKRFLIIALCLAGLAGMAAAQPNPWDPNYYTGTFRGHGDFVPKGNGVWDLGDPGNHWRKAYVDSLLGSALIGYADSSHRADSVLFQGSYIALSKYLYTNYNDTNFFFGLGCGNSSVSRYSNGFGYGALGAAGTLTLFSNAFGFEALKNIGGASANGNHGFGHKVLTTLTAGVDNDGFGLNAMRDLQSGNNNSAFGDQALMLLTTGDQNSGFGQSVMLNADSCYKNAGFGAEALYNTIGTGNIGFGYQALYNNLRSNYRIGIGYQVDAAIWPDTLRQDTTIAIGFKASSDSQGIAMGDSAVAMQKNSGALGNHTTARLRNYFTILNIDSDTLRSAQGILLAATKPIQWAGGAYLKDTLGTRLRSISAMYDSVYALNVLPGIVGTGTLGTTGNRWNAFRGDTVAVASYVIDSVTVNAVAALRINNTHFNMNGGHPRICGDGTSLILGSTNNDGVLGLFPTFANFYLPDSGKYSKRDSITAINKITVTGVGGLISSDTAKHNNILSKSGGKIFFGPTDTVVSIKSIYVGSIANGSQLSAVGTLTYGATGYGINLSASTFYNMPLWSMTAIGSTFKADTLSGYNGNTWAVNSWGITITGVDTLGKFYMSSFDSLKMVRCWASAKTASIGGNPDTLVYMDSLKTDSVKVPWAVGFLWLAPAVINKKWPTNPGGVLNPVYCIFRKGATTAAANLQVWTSYGLSKGRMF